MVDEVSANPGLAHVRPIPVDADHIDICKPVDRKAPVYGRVKRFVADIAASIQESPSDGAQYKQPFSGAVSNTVYDVTGDVVQAGVINVRGT